MITTDAMDELCGLMRQEQLTPEVFGAWVRRQAVWRDGPDRCSALPVAAWPALPHVGARLERRLPLSWHRG